MEWINRLVRAFWSWRLGRLKQAFDRVVQKQDKLVAIYGSSTASLNANDAHGLRIIRELRRCRWHLREEKSQAFQGSGATMKQAPVDTPNKKKEA